MSLSLKMKAPVKCLSLHFSFKPDPTVSQVSWWCYLLKWYVWLSFSVVTFDILSDDYSKVWWFSNTYCLFYMHNLSVLVFICMLICNVMYWIAAGVPPYRSLCWVPLSAWLLLQNTHSEVWTRLFLPLPFLWSVFCGSQASIGNISDILTILVRVACCSVMYCALRYTFFFVLLSQFWSIQAQFGAGPFPQLPWDQCRVSILPLGGTLVPFWLTLWIGGSCPS